jgi:hypothetical protein
LEVVKRGGGELVRKKATSKRRKLGLVLKGADATIAKKATTLVGLKTATTTNNMLINYVRKLHN